MKKLKVDMNSIDPLTTFNIWFIRNYSKTYKFMDSIDLSFKFDMEVYKKVAEVNFSVAHLMITKELGTRLLKELKKQKWYKEYDAFCWQHTTCLKEFEEVYVTIDCFKKSGGCKNGRRKS